MAILKQYDNGLRVVIEPMSGFESVAFHVFVKTGSLNEQEGNFGISHFIEHMLFKGTTKRSAFEIVDELEAVGANVNAYTDKTETCYYTKSTNDNLEKCVDVLSDMFFNSVFDAKEMAREKKVVCEEISMYNDDAFSQSLILANKIFYNGTKFALDVAGTKQSVHRLTKEKIQEYMNKFYIPSNVIISFAGNITEKKALKLVEKYFLNNFNQKSPEKEKSVKYTTKIEQNQIKAYKDNEQAQVCICFPALMKNDERSYALKIFNFAFGGGMSSRLFQRIREKLGLVYTINISSYINDAGGDTSIHFATSTKNVPLALKAIREEIENVKNNGLTEKEFVNSKNCYLSTTKISFENTSTFSLANAKRVAFYNKPVSKKENIEKVQAVTIEDINNLIKEIFDFDKCCISYVGKNSKINLWKYFV